MRAAVLYGKEDVRIEDIPTPTVNESEVLVRVETALTCGTDVKVFKRGYHAQMIKPPSVFGHEFSGVVVEAGKNVQDWLDKRVVAANSAPCDTCFYCRIGRQSLCENIQWLNGAYAEFIKIPDRIVEKNLLEIPTHVSFNEAALVEPLACVVHGMEESNIKENDTVVINGSGPIGLMFVVLTKLRNTRVVVCDASKDRLQIAREVGADETININEVDQVQAIREFTEHGADVAIEAVGLPEVWEKAIAMVRKGGTVNLFGGCPSGTSIRVDTKTVHYDEVTLKGVFHHTPRYVRQALQLIAEKKIDATKLISKEMPLENLVEALREMMNQKVIKIAIKP
jgi:L-iditol 2-dehydrogenase